MTARLPNRGFLPRSEAQRRGCVPRCQPQTAYDHDLLDEQFAVAFMAGAQLEGVDPDLEWVPTGLLDASGEPLFRYIKQPLGFLWHDENGELRQRHEFEGEDPAENSPELREDC